MSKPEHIHVCGGKYTVVINGGALVALRYGEPWQDLTGNNLVYWLAAELHNARADVENRKYELKAAQQMADLVRLQRAHGGGLPSEDVNEFLAAFPAKVNGGTP